MTLSTEIAALTGNEDAATLREIDGKVAVPADASDIGALIFLAVLSFRKSAATNNPRDMRG